MFVHADAKNTDETLYDTVVLENVKNLSIEEKMVQNEAYVRTGTMKLNTAYRTVQSSHMTEESEDIDFGMCSFTNNF